MYLRELQPLFAALSEEERGKGGLCARLLAPAVVTAAPLAQLSPVVPSCLPTCLKWLRARGRSQPGAWSTSCPQGRFAATPSSSPAVGLTACQGSLVPQPLTCRPGVSNPPAIWLESRFQKRAALKKCRLIIRIHAVEKAHGHLTFVYL